VRNLRPDSTAGLGWPGVGQEDAGARPLALRKADFACWKQLPRYVASKS